MKVKHVLTKIHVRRARGEGQAHKFILIIILNLCLSQPFKTLMYVVIYLLVTKRNHHVEARRPLQHTPRHQTPTRSLPRRTQTAAKRRADRASTDDTSANPSARRSFTLTRDARAGRAPAAAAAAGGGSPSLFSCPQEYRATLEPWNRVCDEQRPACFLLSVLAGWRWLSVSLARCLLAVASRQRKANFPTFHTRGASTVWDNLSCWLCLSLHC